LPYAAPSRRRSRAHVRWTGTEHWFLDDDERGVGGAAWRADRTARGRRVPRRRSACSRARGRPVGARDDGHHRRCPRSDRAALRLSSRRSHAWTLVRWAAPRSVPGECGTYLALGTVVVDPGEERAWDVQVLFDAESNARVWLIGDGGQWADPSPPNPLAAVRGEGGRAPRSAGAFVLDLVLVLSSSLLRSSLSTSLSRRLHATISAKHPAATPTITSPARPRPRHRGPKPFTSTALVPAGLRRARQLGPRGTPSRRRRRRRAITNHHHHLPAAVVGSAAASAVVGGSGRGQRSAPAWPPRDGARQRCSSATRPSTGFATYRIYVHGEARHGASSTRRLRRQPRSSRSADRYAPSPASTVTSEECCPVAFSARSSRAAWRRATSSRRFAGPQVAAVLGGLVSRRRLHVATRARIRCGQVGAPNARRLLSAPPSSSREPSSAGRASPFAPRPRTPRAKPLRETTCPSFSLRSNLAAFAATQRGLVAAEVRAPSTKCPSAPARRRRRTERMRRSLVPAHEERRIHEHGRAQTNFLPATLSVSTSPSSCGENASATVLVDRLEPCGEPRPATSGISSSADPRSRYRTSSSVLDLPLLPCFFPDVGPHQQVAPR